MADAFLSYARVDKAQVGRIHEALKASGKDVWIDWEGIPPTAEWMAEIEAAIEAADYFVFAVSPASAASEICRLEIEHALAHRKRIIPLLIRKGDVTLLHPDVASINWIAFDDPAGFDAALETLQQALATDLDYVRAHTRLLVKAREWEANGQDASFLLQGTELARAEALIGAAQEPVTTALQAQFVIAGRAAADRRRRRLAMSLVVALVIALGLAAWALVQQGIAEDNERLALQREQTAQRLRFDSDMKLAYSEWERGRVDQALRLLDSHADRQGHFVWRYLNRLARSDERVFELPRPVSVRFAEGDRALYAGGDDTGLRRWNLADGGSADGPLGDGWVDSIDVSADGGLVWIDDGDVFYRSDRQTEPLTLRARDGESVRFSPDGQTVAISTRSKVLLWQVGEGRVVRRIAQQERVAAAALSFIPGTRLLAIGGDDGLIRIWSLDQPGEITRLQAPSKRRFYSLAASPDGRYLAAAVTSHGSIQLWRVEDWQRRTLAEAYHNSPTDGLLAFSPDSRHLASPDGDLVRLWEVDSGALVKTYRGHAKPISSLDWSTDGKRLASASYDGSVRVWSALDDQRWSMKQLALEEWADQHHFRLSPDRRYLLAGAQEIGVYDLPGLSQRTVLAHSGPVVSLNFSDDGRQLATVTGPYEEEMDWGGAEIAVWQLDDGRRLASVPPDGQGVLDVRFADADQVLLIETEDDEGRAHLRRWDIARDRERPGPGSPNPVEHKAGSGMASRVLVAPGGQGKARIERSEILLTPAGGGADIRLSSHREPVTGMDYSPDGQVLASISHTLIDAETATGELKLWDSRTGAELIGFELPGDLREVGFSADGELLIVVTAGGRVYRFHAGAVQ